MALGEALSLLMFVCACGLLILGYPVALTLAGAGLLFASLGTIFGVFDWNLLGSLPFDPELAALCDRGGSLERSPALSSWQPMRRMPQFLGRADTDVRS